MGEREGNNDQISDGITRRAVASGDDIVARFAATTDGRDASPIRTQRRLPDLLCQAALRLLAVDGVAISVYLGDDITVPVGAAGQDAATAEALQFTLREGPCLHSYTTKAPVLIPDLTHPTSPARSTWPTYTGELSRRTGYQAVSAFPLLDRDQAKGSLSLYRRSPGQPGDLRTITAIAAQVGARLVEAELFTAETAQSEHPWIAGPNTRRRRQVWIAQGMAMHAGNLTAAEALDLLRAHAHTTGRLVDDVAEDIISGRLPVPGTLPEQ